MTGILVTSLTGIEHAMTQALFHCEHTRTIVFVRNGAENPLPVSEFVRWLKRYDSLPSIKLRRSRQFGEPGFHARLLLLLKLLFASKTAIERKGNANTSPELLLWCLTARDRLSLCSAEHSICSFRFFFHRIFY